jgi:hypothetical protein
MGCVVPQHLPLEGTGRIQNFCAVIVDPRYLGYKTPIVAPEPSVEWAVENILLMGGRIGNHMLLWALPQDLMMRLWG